MAKISKELLRKEIKDWKTLKKLLHRQVVNFGPYMEKKYRMRDSNLSQVENNREAIRIILKNYVQELQVWNSF